MSIEKAIRSSVRDLDNLRELKPRTRQLEEVTEKAYDLLSSALDQAQAKLDRGEIEFTARDVIQLLQLFKPGEHR